MTILSNILLLTLVICAVSVTISRNLLNSVLIFMGFSLVMSIIWMLLESPDLAITEAAVGAGVTSVLFFITLKRINAIIEDDTADTNKASQEADEMYFDGDLDANADINSNEGKEV